MAEGDEGWTWPTWGSRHGEGAVVAGKEEAFVAGKEGAVVVVE
jgi:hypothetical protein